MNFINSKLGKLGLVLGTAAGAVGAYASHALAACTPGSGELCAADLQPILDAGLDRWKDTAVSFLTFLLPVIIVIGFFYIIYRLFRRGMRHA